MLKIDGCDIGRIVRWIPLAVFGALCAGAGPLTEGASSGIAVETGREAARGSVMTSVDSRVWTEVWAEDLSLVTFPAKGIVVLFR